MRKVILLLLMIISNYVFAQEANKFRFGINTGLIFQNGSTGGVGEIEPKFNITDELNIGLKIGSAFINKTYDKTYDLQTVNTVVQPYLLLTVNKYFDVTNSKFIPFVGAGLGYVSISEYEDDIYIQPKSGLGGMAQGGFEFGKFRFALEYNFFPKSLAADSYSSNTIYNLKNSYFGLNIGVVFGGGKW